MKNIDVYRRVLSKDDDEDEFETTKSAFFEAKKNKKVAEIFLEYIRCDIDYSLYLKDKGVNPHNLYPYGAHPTIYAKVMNITPNLMKKEIVFSCSTRSIKSVVDRVTKYVDFINNKLYLCFELENNIEVFLFLPIPSDNYEKRRMVTKVSDFDGSFFPVGVDDENTVIETPQDITSEDRLLAKALYNCILEDKNLCSLLRESRIDITEYKPDYVTKPSSFYNTNDLDYSNFTFLRFRKDIDVKNSRFVLQLTFSKGICLFLNKDINSTPSNYYMKELNMDTANEIRNDVADAMINWLKNL